MPDCQSLRSFACIPPRPQCFKRIEGHVSVTGHSTLCRTCCIGCCMRPSSIGSVSCHPPGGEIAADFELVRFFYLMPKL